MADPSVKDLVKRIEALEKALEKANQKSDRRWEALGDAVGETSILLGNINDALRQRVASLEAKVAKLTKA